MYPRPDELTALCAVDEHGSVSAAARALGVNQQTVSARVRRAEDRLHLTAFRRSPYGTVTTDQGRIAIDAARELLAAFERFDAALSTTTSHLQVAVSHTVAELYFPAWAADFHRHHPQVQVAMVQANSARVRDLVEAGRVPLGIVEGGVPRHSLREVGIGEDELIVVAPTGHPWSLPGTRVTREMLRTTALVVREPGSGSREVTEDVLGHLATPAGEFGSLASQRAGMISLQAPGIIAAGAVADAIILGRLARVHTPGLSFRRDLVAVRLAHGSPGPEAEEFLRVIRSPGD